MVLRIKKNVRIVACFLLLDMLASIFMPAIHGVYALTSGPGSPEFSSFEPVATTNMVDPFSGNFTYNLPVLQIPGPDGGGYAMSLSYHSGTSPEEESSWVGYGWTLNPGAINRSVRGIPDEYNNTPIDYYNKSRANWTMSGTTKASLEFFSNSGEGGTDANPATGTPGNSGGNTEDESLLSINISKYLRYNNFQGYAKTTSIGLSKAFGSLSMNKSATGITFSATINPFAAKAKKRGDHKKQKKAEGEKFVRFAKVSKDDVKKAFRTTANTLGGGAVSTLFGLHSFTDVGQSVSLTKMRGYNINVSFGLELNPVIVPIGFEGGTSGSFSANYSRGLNTEPAYGYLHTPNFLGHHKQDYVTERNQAFDKRDYFLGIPFSMPDSYMLTGEGLSGGFRAYQKSIGHNHPERIEGGDSRRRTFGLGIEVMIGTNIGVGVNLAFGSSKSEMRDWRKKGNLNDDQFKFNGDGHIYRFNGDMGGSIEYGTNALTNANLDVRPNFPGIKGARANMPTGEVADLNLTKATSSSYIEEVTGGFSIHNDAGLKYTYAEPVLVRNNTSVSVDVTGDVDNNYLAYGTNLFLNGNGGTGNEYKIDECNQEVVIGEIKTQPYAVNHLLSNITTSDYIDLGAVGPDEEDFGGWTKFEYHKKYGTTTDDWYRWRIPYNGVLYNKGSISDTKDDVGYLNTGEKEVHYLKKIETKTHIAYFVTNKTTPDRFGIADTDPEAAYLSGTGVSRNDGLGANKPVGVDPATLRGDKGIDELEYIEKVVLFAKERKETPLQTTNFAYDYALMPNLPNNTYGSYPDNVTAENSGKLTLRKVWSEFEGVVSARTSSYQFGYRYKDVSNFTDDVKEENAELNTFFDLSNRYSVNAQNPAYDPHTLDAWGNHQYNGQNRHLNMRSWPYQGVISEDAYDPAAWQLKQIKLPSGGEMLVEYEEKDYKFVQDRDAMALVKLRSANDAFHDPSYELDLSDIGYDVTDTTVDASGKTKVENLVTYLKKYFLDGVQGTEDIGGVETAVLKANKRIYFKFLYALRGNDPRLDNCKSEYITGYAKVKDVVFNTGSNTISIVLDTTSDGNNLIGDGIFESPIKDEGYRLAPRQGCYDYFVTQRWGKYEAGCEGLLEQQFDHTVQNDIAKVFTCGGTIIENVGAIIESLGFAVGSSVFLAGAAVGMPIPPKETTCLTINEDLSYLKIPINKAKRGGGSRVKRIMMYDKGIELGDAAIYGSTYKYELEDGTSSGVATNEPQDMREENPLVGFLPKKDQSWLNRLIVGKDREQSEGPIGESLLPGASIGHSRVVVENIYSGKSGTGHTVHQYYTCRDYAFDKRYDYQFEKENGSRQFDFAAASGQNAVSFSVLHNNSTDDKLRIPTPNFKYSLENAWATQGFRFMLTEMHGKPKSVKTFGGKYNAGQLSYVSSGQDFEYFEPGEMVKLLKENGEYEWDIPGKEMDVTMEKYRVYNQNLDFNFEIDVSVGLSLTPPIFASGWLQFSFSEQNLSKQATSKVIRYPVIQKKVTTYSDNIASATENLGFDYATGKPILTKTTDAYHGINTNLSDETITHDGSIYALNIPAHWKYAAMGRKSVDPSYTNQLMASSGAIVTYGQGASPLSAIDNTWSIKTDKVVSASANTFNTLANVGTWMDANMHTVYGSSGAVADLEKVWRLHKSYVFKDDTKNSSDRITDFGKIYEGGIYNDFTLFDYSTDGQADDRWIKVNEVTKYSPHGNALEEKDALGIFSAAKFGYKFTQPTMIAGNAQYSEIYFEDYENEVIAVIGGHSGNKSKEVPVGVSTILVSDVKVKDHINAKGAWLKFWVKGEGNTAMDIVYNGSPITSEKVAKTGAWSLYRAFMPETLFTTIGDPIDIYINNNTLDPIYVDDVKFQPKETQSTCYVYDVKSLRLITQFDDQHFGMYYQYNGEGKLVRKLIETERGLKTISETQYNVPREIR